MGNGHTHDFVDSYDGLVGFGADRVTDEATVQVYLQKFSDDSFMKAILPRLTDDELEEVFDLINRLLVRHLKESEYHRIFLKDGTH